jgi:6-pyruvoyltetrahydropterin/6-carboxytetrahydropterin synthase
MVVDFAEIKARLKQWIDENWDHRMILEKGDPLIEVLQQQGEPVYVLDSPTTAENLARRLFVVAKKSGLPVVCVMFWETPNSVASYLGRTE